MIYLDYNATTPIAPEVADAMRPFLTGGYGNPSSTHVLGREARRAIDRARQQTAALIGADADEIIFTSGGTEASNTAIKGVAYAAAERRRHMITSVVEHPATLEPCRFLERSGWQVTRLPVDLTAMVDPDDVRRAITPDTALISIMHAQNEVGTIEPIAEIGRIAREAGVPFHVDAAQSLGKIPVRVDDLHIDLLSIAGHKLYAPKGIGALYVRSGIRFEPLMHGAGHERGRRPGTEATHQIVALGAACELAGQYVAGDQVQAVRSLRDRLHELLIEAFGDRLALNGHPTYRLPNTLNLSILGRIGSTILDAMDDVCASTGSACHAGEHIISPILAAMGVAHERALGAIRFSLGRYTTLDEITTAAARIRNAAS